MVVVGRKEESYTFVQRKQPTLASSLDQLIWLSYALAEVPPKGGNDGRYLCNELGALREEPRVCNLSLVKNSLGGGILGEVKRCQSWCWKVR